MFLKRRENQRFQPNERMCVPASNAVGPLWGSVSPGGLLAHHPEVFLPDTFVGRHCFLPGDRGDHQLSKLAMYQRLQQASHGADSKAVM